jgi:hypothetical protein
MTGSEPVPPDPRIAVVESRLDDDRRRLERKIENIGWLACWSAAFGVAAFVLFVVALNFHPSRDVDWGVFAVTFLAAGLWFRHVIDQSP